MENLFTIQSFLLFYAEYQLLIMLFIMIVFLYPFLMTIKTVVLPGISKLIRYKSRKYAGILCKKSLSRHIIKVFLALYLELWSDIFDQSNLINNVTIKIKDVVVTTYVIFAITSLILAIINTAADLYNIQELNKKIAIELHTQILRIFVVVSAILAIFSLVIGISISSLFASLGAAAALLTFVFKDTLLGLIASLQVTFQNIIQVGDWVTLPQYNADGDIQKITITVVVIRNFDNTCTTVPTSAFLTTGVKNWRSMFERGGRRIKRAISIDMSTIKICTKKELSAIKKLPYMLELVAKNKTFFNQENQTTNLTIFRHYIGQYLRNNKNIHQEGFTFLVRTLDPTPNGIPIEIYVFTKDTKWPNYEEVQASIFEHLLGMLPFFKLKAFQTISLP